MNPGGTIHPILTPIYSSPGHRGAGDGFWEEASASPGWPETAIEQESHTQARIRPARPMTRRAIGETDMELPPPAPESAPVAESRAAAADSSAEKNPGTENRGAGKTATERKAGTTMAAASFTPLMRRVEGGRAEKTSADSVGDGETAGEAQGSAEGPVRNRATVVMPQPERHISDFPRLAGASIDAAREAEAEPMVEPFENWEAREQSGEAEKPQVVFRERFTPLIEQSTVPGRGNVADRNVLDRNVSDQGGNRPAPAARKEEKRGALDGGKQPAREPDEIQIHIGRIEVTAVPPPPAPAGRPQRRPVSLDEYLKSRHGRT